MTADTDGRLVDRLARSGDARAFDALYESNADRLYRFALRLTCGDRHLADDLFQDTWVVAIAKLARFEGRSSLFTWLAGIATNKYRNRSVRWFEELEREPEGSPTALRDDARLDVESILGTLAPGYRTVLVLNAEGFTHKEIGEMLEISEGTSKSQLSRARRAVQGLIGASDG